MKFKLITAVISVSCVAGVCLWLPLRAQTMQIPPNNEAAEATEDAETVASSTQQELLSKFLAQNSDAHAHTLNMVTNGYADSADNGGLRLNRMWVSQAGTLVEIEGLSVRGRSASAVIREDTFQLVHKGGRANVQTFEGAARLKDRRGGGAIVVKPGDKLLVLFGPVDDAFPMRLQHTVNNGQQVVYFDAIDPHFKTRYVASYQTALAIAATPEQMKDFLVEFAANDPDNKSREVFLKLINAMRAQKTFEGYYNAYLLIQDPEDARKASALSVTDEHRVKIENMAVTTLVDKNRLFDFDFRLNPSSTTSSEGGCWMACRYNFSAERSVTGQISVRMQPNSPIKLKQGSYKVVLSAQVNMPRRKIRSSAWLGNYDGADDINFSRDIAITVAPPNYSASIASQLGSLNVAFFQRGSAGGYEGSWATSNAAIQIRIKSVELIR
jgi:hypothetical protein